MTIDETNLLHKKAETKKDGIYSFKGNLWAVRNGKFIAFVNTKGVMLHRYGAFNHQVKDLSNIDKWQWKNKFKEWLSQI